ncbi:MAG TPA: MerR family transcriptional regulator [Gaiellales bacterium]|nr:MerR family transcriptional regulator [Gaiellales bacterium]
MSEQGVLRIGELSRRVGVSPELLRAWERRYGLLRPTRSQGGFRLYSTADEERVRRMLALQQQGLSAAVAARTAAGEADSPDDPTPAVPTESLRQALAEALDRFDEAAANRVFDRALGSLSLDTLLRDIVLDYLTDLGERWSTGEATVAQEHFASNVLRGRLLGLARDWGQGGGPLALLACPPGELHDLGLICFALALHARGWRIAFLGADTPLDTLTQTADRLHPQLVVLTATTPQRLSRVRSELRALGEATRLAIAGAGATRQLAASVGAELLEGDPVSQAARIGARA